MLEVDRSVAFRAMGTRVRVFVPTDAPDGAVVLAVEAVRCEFDDQERRFSRFRADSELSAVNRSAGSSIAVSPTFAAVMGIALRAAADTGGLFDPTVLGALVAAGYDRDFDEVLAGARDVLHPTLPAARWRDVSLVHGRLRAPEGVGLDLGGIVKGWTCDRAAERALDAGLPWVLVDAGGDIRIMGDAPRIAVGVEDPDDADRGTFLRVGLDDGALATSCVTRRRWGVDLHHLIDPRTGHPAITDVVQATAWAPTCAEAEIAAKVLLLEGEPALGRIAGVVVRADGPAVTNLAEAA